MGEFEYWYENVVSEAELIASDSALPRKWIDKEEGLTSAYDHYELLEQLLGDLDLPTSLQVFADDLRRLNALDEVCRFAASLLALDTAIKRNPKLSSAREVLDSLEWRALKRTAISLIDLPSSSPFRSNTGD